MSETVLPRPLPVSSAANRAQSTVCVILSTDLGTIPAARIKVEMFFWRVSLPPKIRRLTPDGALVFPLLTPIQEGAMPLGITSTGV